MSFDDTLDYWVDNPDERSFDCLACGFQSDDDIEFVGHLRTHEKVDVRQHAYDVWLEDSAA